MASVTVNNQSDKVLEGVQIKVKRVVTARFDTTYKRTHLKTVLVTCKGQNIPRNARTKMEFPITIQAESLPESSETALIDIKYWVTMKVVKPGLHGNIRSRVKMIFCEAVYNLSVIDFNFFSIFWLKNLKSKFSMRNKILSQFFLFQEWVIECFFRRNSGRWGVSQHLFYEVQEIRMMIE